MKTSSDVSATVQFDSELKKTEQNESLVKRLHLFAGAETLCRTDVIELRAASQLCSLKAKDLPFQRDDGERMTFRMAIK